MLVVLSHFVAFAALMVGAIYDLKTTEVPDPVFAAGAAAGLLLHAAQAVVTGSPEPLLWSIGVGLVFSVYGWGSYFVGMWGGADAFAMSVLGFAAPYGLNGFGVAHPVNVFVNVMLLGFLYTFGYAVYTAFRSGGVFAATYRKVLENERRITLEILVSALASILLGSLSFNPFIYFAVFVFMILLLRFLQVIESEEMSRTVDVGELEEGDVLSEELDIEFQQVREKNLPGRLLTAARTNVYLPSRIETYLSGLEQRIGYPEVVGLTGEDIDRIREEGFEEVRVRTGVRFVPVFPVALLLSDLGFGGLTLLLWLASL